LEISGYEHARQDKIAIAPSVQLQQLDFSIESAIFAKI
jgi:hypothetical protein